MNGKVVEVTRQYSNGQRIVIAKFDTVSVYNNTLAFEHPTLNVDDDVEIIIRPVVQTITEVEAPKFENHPELSSEEEYKERMELQNKFAREFSDDSPPF